MLRLRSKKKASFLYHAKPNFLRMSLRTCSMSISTGKSFGQTSTQLVHKKQLSKIAFAFASNSRLPLWYAPKRSKKPRGEVTSSALTLWMVQTGMHFPHFIQSSVIDLKSNIELHYHHFVIHVLLLHQKYFFLSCMPSRYYKFHM